MAGIIVTKEDNETLVARAQDGDQSAFDQLVWRHQDRLKSIVAGRMSSKVRQQIEVDDLVQETFLRAYQAIAQFSWQGDESFFRWLYEDCRAPHLECLAEVSANGVGFKTAT